MFLTLVGAFGISLIVVLATMPLLISYLHKINYNQTVSEYSLEEYKQKQKTPTMGGIVFVLTASRCSCSRGRSATCRR